MPQKNGKKSDTRTQCDSKIHKSFKQCQIFESFKSNQIDVLFKKIQDMRQRFYDTNHEIQTLHDTLKNKKNFIKTLKTEKNAAMTKLKKKIEILEQKIQKFKSDFLNFMSEGDDFSIETATATTIKKKTSIYLFCWMRGIFDL